MDSTANMTHEEWLINRRKGIGGSDVAKILGLSKYSSAFTIWLDKTGQLPINTSEVSEAAYWGTLMEDVVAQEFEKRTGKKVAVAKTVFEHKDYPYLRANVDRVLVDEDAILECKTASEYLKNDWKDDEIPVAYLAQVQHYLNVLDKPKAYIACLIGGNKFIWKEIQRDNELIAMIQERLVDFWENHVLTGVPPEVDGQPSTKEFLGKLYGDDYQENVVELSAVQQDDLTDLKRLKQTKKEIEEAITLIENKVKKTLGESEATYGNSQEYLVSWKPYSRTTVDSKRLKETYPDIYDEVSQVTTAKRFAIKEKE